MACGVLAGRGGCVGACPASELRQEHAVEQWQTYVDEAKVFLNFAEDWQRRDDPDRQGASALTGIGWALLALVERQKPQDEVMEVRSSGKPTGIPEVVCALAGPHEAHLWALSDAAALRALSFVSTPTSLRWCRGVA